MTPAEVAMRAVKAVEHHSRQLPMLDDKIEAAVLAAKALLQVVDNLKVNPEAGKPGA